MSVQGVFFLMTLGFLAFIGYMLWSFRKEVPYVPTPRHVVRRMINAVPLRPGMQVLDLGSGHGRIVRAIARRYPVTVIGIEDSPVLIAVSRFLTLLGRLRGRYRGTIRFQQGNFHHVSLRTADAVLCFLTDEVMASLAATFVNELRPGARIVSYRFPLPATTAFTHTEVSVGKRPAERLYVYTKVA